MRYDGNDLNELADFLLTAYEPVTVAQSFLTEEDTADMSTLHGWIFQSDWAYTDVIATSANSVSSRTRYFQRLWPPVDWVWPEDRPDPPETIPTDPDDAPNATTPTIPVDESESDAGDTNSDEDPEQTFEDAPAGSTSSIFINI